MPVMPWTRTGGLAIEKDGHAFTTFRFADLSFFQAATARLAASAKRVGADDGKAGAGQDLAALFDMRAGEAHHDRHVDRILLQRLHDAFGHPVAAVDAGEDVDEDGLAHSSSDVTSRKALATRSGVAPPPMSRKLAGSPPAA